MLEGSWIDVTIYPTEEKAEQFPGEDKFLKIRHAHSVTVKVKDGRLSIQGDATFPLRNIDYVEIVLQQEEEDYTRREIGDIEYPYAAYLARGILRNTPTNISITEAARALCDRNMHDVTFTEQYSDGTTIWETSYGSHLMVKDEHVFRSIPKEDNDEDD